MAGVDTQQLRMYFQTLTMRGTLNWIIASDIYDMGRQSVEASEFRSAQGKADWDLLKDWVTKATGDNRTNPGEETLDKLQQASMRILRRLDARANGVVSANPEEDAMTADDQMTLAVYEPEPPLRWLGRSGGAKRKSQTAKFCRCIKQVRKTIRPRKGSTKESAAIGVCVRSVLHSRGRTVKKFKCGKTSRLVTQKRR